MEIEKGNKAIIGYKVTVFVWIGFWMAWLFFGFLFLLLLRFSFLSFRLVYFFVCALEGPWPMA